MPANVVTYLGTNRARRIRVTSVMRPTTLQLRHAATRSLHPYRVASRIHQSMCPIALSICAPYGSPYAVGPLSCLSVTLVYCGQTVGWIKMPLGTQVGLGPGHIVLDGDPAPPRIGAEHPPLFYCSQTVAHLGKC